MPIYFKIYILEIKTMNNKFNIKIKTLINIINRIINYQSKINNNNKIINKINKPCKSMIFN